MTELIGAALSILLIVLKAFISGELDKKALDAEIKKLQDQADARAAAAEAKAREDARKNQAPASDLQDQLDKEQREHGNGD